MIYITRLYASASSAAVRTSRFEGIVMPIIFHHHKELHALYEEMCLIDECLGEKHESG